MASQERSTSRPFWIVAGASLLWSVFGAFDFTMTMIRNGAYIEQFPPGMMDYIGAMPIWATIAWAAGVWGAVAGSFLLLLRSRYAVAAFAVSLAGLALTTLHQVASGMPPAMRTPAMLVMTVLIWAVAILLLLYARAMTRAGVLR